MNSIEDYIGSGILELYVLGNTSSLEAISVENMALNHPEIAEEIKHISAALYDYAKSVQVYPDPIIKPFLLATIDYTERLKNGETVSFPPMLHQASRPQDYEMWLQAATAEAPKNLKDVHAKIIGYTEKMVTAIVWIKDMAPQEVHDNEIEKFLIIEGTCEIIIDNEVHPLVAGDMLSIPLHKSHFVKVTSLIPCKFILQRIAA